MRIAPSILAADFGDLRSGLRLCEQGGVELLHVDVMDGRFVPNLSFGPPVIHGIRRHTDMPLDIHLMVDEPERLIDLYLELEPRWVSVHAEATRHLDRLVAHIQSSGVGAGVALNPATPIETLRDLLPSLDFVLVMSVNPGFGGQSFIDYTLDKVRRLRQRIEGEGLDVEIEIDGGVARPNIAEVRDAGADVAVVGSGIFAADEPLAELGELRQRAGESA